MASRTAVRIVAPETDNLLGGWGSEVIEFDGRVRRIRENVSVALAYAEARAELAGYQDLVVSFKPFDKAIQNPDDGPSGLGIFYTVRCKVGLHEPGMWCRVVYDNRGDLIYWEKIGTTPFHDLGDERYETLVQQGDWRPSEGEMRHGILATDFVPEVAEIAANPRNRAAAPDSRAGRTGTATSSLKVRVGASGPPTPTARGWVVPMTVLMEQTPPLQGLTVEELLDMAPAADPLPDHVRNADEQKAVDEIDRRQMERGLAPSWFARRNEDGSYLVAPNHIDQEAGQALTMEALGITSPNVLASIVQTLAKLAVVDGVVSETRLNQLMALVRAIGPETELEAMMATQMLAIHSATMEYSIKLGSAKSPEMRDIYERGINRLARTFAAQMTTLKQFRTGGQQKVVVQHVHVNEGGQAVVGDVSTGGRRQRGRVTP